jgi:hypothetical protein
MSTHRLLLEVLGSLHARLVGVEDDTEHAARILESVGTKLDTLVGLVVRLGEDVEVVRSRLIEDASRRAEELHRHQRAIVEHEARLHKLERAASGAE